MGKSLVLGVLGLLVGLGAASQTRDPIVIRSDGEFTEDNGVVGGLGIFGNPFVISGWRINAGGAPYGILIQGTRRPVVLRNLEIESATLAAIQIVNAKNVVIEDVVIRGSATAIAVTMGEVVQIRNTSIDECYEGVRVMFSSQVEVAKILVSRAKIGVWFTNTRDSLLVGSIVAHCDVGILVEMYTERLTIARNTILGCQVPARSDGGASWDDGVKGNFWAGFTAPDLNNDGIFDWPYLIGRDEDRFPLVSPPSP